MITIGDTFKIGEICQESGIYRLRNCADGSCLSKSQEQQTIPLTKGERFPPCRNCSGSIEWEFIQKA